MSRLKRWWSAWVLLLSRKERCDSLALFRIATGAVVLLALVPMVVWGIADVVWVHRDFGGYRPLDRTPYLVDWLGGATPTVIHGLLAMTIAGGALLVLGLGGRLTAFVTLQGYIALQRLDHYASGSSDILVTNALWLLVLARSTATLSLDCRIRTGKFTSDEEVSAFPRYLGILQLVALYFTTGVQKLSVYWFPTGSYSALYYVLQQPTWQRFSMTWAARAYPITQVATALTWCWEVTAPLLLVFYYFRETKDRGGRLRAWASKRDYRFVWALIGLGLHLSILAAMDVGHFSQMSLAFYACLIRPDELVAAKNRILSRFSRSKEAQTAGS